MLPQLLHFRRPEQIRTRAVRLVLLVPLPDRFLAHDLPHGFPLAHGRSGRAAVHDGLPGSQDARGYFEKVDGRRWNEAGGKGRSVRLHGRGSVADNKIFRFSVSFDNCDDDDDDGAGDDDDDDSEYGYELSTLFLLLC